MQTLISATNAAQPEISCYYRLIDVNAASGILSTAPVASCVTQHNQVATHAHQVQSV